MFQRTKNIPYTHAEVTHACLNYSDQYIFPFYNIKYLLCQWLVVTHPKINTTTLHHRPCFVQIWPNAEDRYSHPPEFRNSSVAAHINNAVILLVGSKLKPSEKFTFRPGRGAKTRDLDLNYIFNLLGKKQAFPLLTWAPTGSYIHRANTTSMSASRTLCLQAQDHP